MLTVFRFFLINCSRTFSVSFAPLALHQESQLMVSFAALTSKSSQTTSRERDDQQDDHEDDQRDDQQEPQLTMVSFAPLNKKFPLDGQILQWSNNPAMRWCVFHSCVYLGTIQNIAMLVSSNFVEFSIQSNSNQSPAFSPNQDTISTISPPPEVQTNFANFPSSSVQTYHLFGKNFCIVWNLLPIHTSHFYKFRLPFWQDSPFSFFSPTLARRIHQCMIWKSLVKTFF